MTPLVLITGFLGAGKTTLLRSLIPELRAAGLDPSLILNDYQNAKIDAELFRGVTTDIRPISGSCVCCGSREELIGQLENFPHREKSIMLIEANGTTDTPELVEHLTSDPKLRGYALPIQIAVVDAKRWQKRFWHNELERTQIRTATYARITRQDEVKPDRLELVQKDLRELTPAIRAFDLAEFGRELSAIELEVRAMEARRPRISFAQPGRLLGPNSRHRHSHFASAELGLPEAMEQAQLEKFLNALPREVVRAKGLVRFEAGGPLHLFQKVEQSNTVQFVKLANPPVEAAPVVILVGPQLDPEALAGALTTLS